MQWRDDTTLPSRLQVLGAGGEHRVVDTGLGQLGEHGGKTWVTAHDTQPPLTGSISGFAIGSPVAVLFPPSCPQG
jgi:hypothetical protein